ncbi:MAG: N-acetyltransferase family protein [Dehalococcoidales bacterium]|nr:N-acetyltransferase family protein [Dehalococcoidales bacterium]
MNNLSIRPAAIKDLHAITDIYNHAILNTVAAFDLEPKTLEEQRAWFEHHGEKHPVLVAVEGNAVIGWAALSEWSDRQAYAGTAEVSLYIREDSRGKGIGRALGEAIIQAGREAGLHLLIARIAEGNDISIHITESFGFEHIGVMKEAGRKFGRLLDVFMMQKILD